MNIHPDTLAHASRLARKDGYSLRSLIESAYSKDAALAAEYLRDSGVTADEILEILSPQLDRAEAAPVEDATYFYVACAYGEFGDEPGDCSVRVLQGPSGRYYLDEGDEDVRNNAGDPMGYPTQKAAERAAAELAGSLDEAPEDEDAESYVERLDTEARKRATRDGKYVVAWVDGNGPPDAGRRYGSFNDAQREVDAWWRDFKQAYPNAWPTHYPAVGEIDEDGTIYLLEDDHYY